MCVLLIVCVCRLDNLIYGGELSEVVAVLDWELSTLGDPVSDLAYVCMPYHMDPDQPQLKGRYITRRMQNIFTWRANCSIISEGLTLRYGNSVVMCNSDD